MKIRIYEKGELDFFPFYAYTSNFNAFQPKTSRSDGYEMPQIFLVNSGSGMLNIMGKSYSLEKNDFFYIDKNVPHEYHGNGDDFKTSNLSFISSSFEGVKNYYGLKEYGVYKNKNRGSFETSVKNLFEVFDNTREISTLCSLTFSTIISFFDEACKKEYEPIETVYKHLEENYSKMLTLDDILLVYPHSKAKLCRDFKEKYSMTIFEALTTIRLRHAKQLITNFPHISLNVIASSCGFNDVSYFCKMYKRKYNSTPKMQIPSK